MKINAIKYGLSQDERNDLNAIMEKIANLKDEKLTKLTQIQSTIQEGINAKMTVDELKVLFQDEIKPFINSYKQNVQ